jgi:hypothetical protein
MDRRCASLLVSLFAAVPAVAQTVPSPPPTTGTPGAITSLPPSVIAGATALNGVDLPSGQLMAPRLLGPNGEAPLTEHLTQFDPAKLEVRRDANRSRVQLWSGRVLVKDFGQSLDDANTALRLFRDLHVNARGTVGAAGAFEYWLANGEAPVPAGNRQVVPFHADRLKAGKVAGQWSLTDGQIVLANFGAAEADARQALAVARKYQFNQLGVVGQPLPTFKYLLHDPNEETGSRVSGFGIREEAGQRGLSETRAPGPETRRLMSLPDVGVVGTRMPVDWRRLDVLREDNHWRLVAGKQVVADFGQSEREGRQVQQLLQQFRCTEYCAVGTSGFGFFLAGGRAPQGPLIGLNAHPIRPESLNVRSENGSWAVCENMRPLADFGPNEVEARQALAALKHFQFDAVLPLGSGQHLGGLKLFVKSR